MTFPHMNGSIDIFTVIKLKLASYISIYDRRKPIEKTGFSSNDRLSDQEIKHIQDALGHRPRKSLQWLTPAQDYSGFVHVALEC